MLVPLLRVMKGNFLVSNGYVFHHQRRVDGSFDTQRVQGLARDIILPQDRKLSKQFKSLAREIVERIINYIIWGLLEIQAFEEACQMIFVDVSTLKRWGDFISPILGTPPIALVSKTLYQLHLLWEYWFDRDAIFSEDLLMMVRFHCWNASYDRVRPIDCGRALGHGGLQQRKTPHFSFEPTLLDTTVGDIPELYAAKLGNKVVDRCFLTGTWRNGILENGECVGPFLFIRIYYTLFGAECHLAEEEWERWAQLLAFAVKGCRVFIVYEPNEFLIEI